MILVVGGTGFIGKNLVLHLQDLGVPVRVLSRTPDKVFLDRHAPNVQAVTLSDFWADPSAALFGVETVIYLASNSTPGANLDAPWREASDTVGSVMKFMTILNERLEAHVIYLSSGGTVYGETDLDLIPETQPVNPISPYGLGKCMAESSIYFLVRTRGLNATILRPSNPIGRWQVSLSQGVVGALMRAASNNTPFRMIGDGSTVRDYFDVLDLVHAIDTVRLAPETSAGKTWNVGSSQGTSVTELLALTKQISGKEINVEQLPARVGDVSKIVLDTSSIRGELGWVPQIDLETCLERAWSFYA